MKVSVYEINRQFSDRFIDDSVRILGSRVIRKGTFEEDVRENSDLVVVENENGARIALRIRRHKYFDDYGLQFTIRSMTQIGSRNTEFVKMVSGYGDFMLYGFESLDSTIENPKIGEYIYIDLSVFRRVIMSEGYRNGWDKLLSCNEYSNNDGTKFLCFNLKKIINLNAGKGFLITCSEGVKKRLEQEDTRSVNL